MKTSLWQTLKNGFSGSRLFYLFILEGILAQFCASINGFGNTIFATNLGATDAQIGLVQTVPNTAAMLLMLPMGILSDKAHSSRTVPLYIIIGITVGYCIMGLVPMAASWRMALFFIALAFTVGGTALYNAQWQSFFGDVFPTEQRNTVLTFRNAIMSALGLAAPLLCGFLLSQSSRTEDKLRILQIFFLACAVISVLHYLLMLRIPAPPRQTETKNAFSLRQIGTSFQALFRLPAFRLFFIPVVLFYMGWQFDWSMWYLARVQYLEMNEAALSISNSVCSGVQLLTIALMSRMIKRRSPDYTLLFSALGMAVCPFAVIFCAYLPGASRVVVFTLLVALINAPQCAISLSVVQMLLRVSPAEKRSIAVSIFALTTTMTNIIFPYLGVRIYTALGSDFKAMSGFYIIASVFRLFTFLLLLWRYRKLRRQGEIN